MTEQKEKSKAQKIFEAVFGLIALGGGVYLIVQCINLLFV